MYNNVDEGVLVDSALCKSIFQISSFLESFIQVLKYNSGLLQCHDDLCPPPVLILVTTKIIQMVNPTESSVNNETNPNEKVELRDVRGEFLAKERSFGDFLKSFEALKPESEAITKNVGETGDLTNAPTHTTYQEQLESAMNKMGLTMDDYLNARSAWSGDAVLVENVDTTDLASDQELSKLGLNEEEIKEREKVRDLLTDRRDPMAQLLSSNFDAVSSEHEKFHEILEDIRKDTEYIQEIPKWQLEMQKRLDMLQQMRLDIEADSLKQREKGIKDDMDIKSKIKRRVAELEASIQEGKEQLEELKN
ncbi:hypothetical protein EGR_07823 [Echinococcus granulosus]|uniref:Uncharacterized protein n=1 Tax=Echinococcus granulosus TaxID=6210 RepID=W6UGN7_ECHGR|nr:hypothetical protein EGR_07823 [Echinococcus granulosus]EUB57287.1 hypothetical protein EGR_07823 [Echinococcus granulosus]